VKAERVRVAVTAVLVLVAGGCSSTDAPVVTIAGPTLTAVPALDPSLVPPIRPPTTRGPTASSVPPPATRLLDGPEPALDRFIPNLSVVNDKLSLDVEFVDGTTATVSWPESLDLLSRGLVPYGWAFVSGGAARNFFIRPGSVEDALRRLGTTELLGEYVDGDGQIVGLWRPISDQVDYLGFQFENWTVLVYDYRTEARMTEEHRQLWAESFHGDETDEGFLLLSADRPLQLVYAGDYPDPLRMTLRGENGEVRLVPGACQPGSISPSGDGDGVVIWCAETADMTVHAYGPVEFQRLVETGLAVENVSIAVPPPPEDEE
jgi:hypothetical protein